MKRKIRCMFLIIVLISGVLASQRREVVVQAGEADGISGELTVTFNIEEKIMDKYIESFMQKYPDVNVHYECVENYEDVMGDRLESGDYGDVLFVPGFMESMQVPNYFAPLGNYFKMSQKYNYLDSGFKSGNMIYTIPSSGYIMGIAYNKDVFYQAGITRLPTGIDEFLEDMAMIKERTDVVPIRNGVYEGGNYALYLSLIQSVDPTDANEIRKIVKAAANPYESFDTVMQDWNRRWENGRPEGMTTRDRSTTRSAPAAGESTQQNSSSHIVGIDNEVYRIMFSPTEMEYIEGKGKLRIGYLTNQAPFQYQAGTMDELLNPGFEGLSAMMCKVLTDSTRLEAEYVPYGNEEELIQALETGMLDMAVMN